MTDQRMTAEEFESHLPKLRSVAQQTVELARLILVEGKGHGEAADVVGIKRQNVKKRLHTVLTKVHDIPDGYVWFEGWLPADMAAAAKAAAKKADPT